MAETPGRTDRLYLAITTALVILSIAFTPPPPDRQLLRHLGRLRHVIERAVDREGAPTAEAEVERYLDRYGGRIRDVKQVLAAYEVERSLRAYETIRPAVARLMKTVAENPQLGEHVHRLLWEVIP